MDSKQDKKPEFTFDPSSDIKPLSEVAGAKVDEVFIGSGVTLVPGITIGKGARVGAGSVVVGDISKDETVFGNPAKPVDV